MITPDNKQFPAGELIQRRITLMRDIERPQNVWCEERRCVCDNKA
jgi:hypothetical protein